MSNLIRVFVLLLGVLVYSQDTLSVKDGAYGYDQDFKLEINLKTQSDIKALQFDLNFDQNNFTYASTYTLNSDRLGSESDHTITVKAVSDSKIRVLIYSPSNKPFDKADGKLVDFDFKNSLNFGDYSFTVTNVVFDYLDLNDGDDFEIKSMSAGTEGGLSLSLRYSDESFFDDSEDIIQIYPNPAVSNVNLLTDITKNIDNIEVDIYNVLGVSVYKTNIKSISRLNGLDVSMLSSGVYTVRVRMITDKNEEIINVHKLIKK